MRIQVIGGGIAGASIAYHLLKEGHEVTVYDREDQGQATGVSAGIISPWVSQRRNKVWYQLVRLGAAYYPEFIQELESLTGERTGHRKSGAILFFKDEEVLPKAFKRITDKQAEAPEMGELTYLTKDQQQAKFPMLTTEFPSLYLSGASMVNGKQLRDVLQVAVEKLGGEWNQVSSPPEPSADLTIYCAGAWGNEYQQNIPVSHQKAQLLHFTIESDDAFPVVMGLKTHYIVSFGNGRFALGTTHEDTTSYDVSPTKQAQEELMKLAEMYFPGQELKELSMAVGLRPYTPNFLPIVEQINDSLFVVNGLGSSGLTAGPLLGKEISHWVSGKETQLDLSKFTWKEGDGDR